MRFYSIIIPVFNRPEEIAELLESLTQQTYSHFEVLIIEDGSTRPCKTVVENYHEQLEIRYFVKENTGQGFSRNYAYQRAKGDYFIVFDSDCIIPSHYLKTVEEALNDTYLDAFGGPDRAHESFTTVQKAISYSMTSPFTTGGIRGNKKHVGQFHPRSFNMGISKAVYEKTKGYVITRMGEDIEFSIRINNCGFTTGLIENAFVYHKRRTSISQFYKQLFFFGRARINISRFYKKELKVVHCFPSIFLIGLITWLLSAVVLPQMFVIGAPFVLMFIALIAVDATRKYRSLGVGFVAVMAAFTQLMAYGAGMLREELRKLLGDKDPMKNRK